MESIQPGLEYIWWAVALGALSTVSLPIGAWAGLRFSPGPRVTGALAGFGAGALIAALSLELIAPTVESAVGSGHSEGSHRDASVLWSLVASAMAGGIVFLVLDYILSLGGGHLRKMSTAIAWATRRRDKLHREMLRDLCTASVLRLLPPAQIGLMVRDVRPRAFADGDVLFSEGEDADLLYLVRSGEIVLERDGHEVETVYPGQAAGETALVAGAPRLFTARARGPVQTMTLSRDDVERWRQTCPDFDANLTAVTEQRLAHIGELASARAGDAEQWSRDAIAALQQGVEIPTPAELRASGMEHNGAGLAVWLGSLIDGIPESLVIGSGLMITIGHALAAGEPIAFSTVAPVTLIAGLFLSNVPEAMSSAVAMRMQGWQPRSVLLLWLSQMVMISAGAAVGYAIGGEFTHHTQVAIEGLAAGAMLTVIASTMIPEAVHLSGNATVGLSTLSGFLTAILFKLLE